MTVLQIISCLGNIRLRWNRHWNLTPHPGHLKSRPTAVVRGPILPPMQTHLRERTDARALLPAHMKAERTAAEEHTDLRALLRVRVQIDAKEMPDTLAAERQGLARFAVSLHAPEVRRAPVRTLDKEMEILAALSTRPYFARADSREKSPDSGLSTKPAARKLQAPALPVWQPSTEANELPSRSSDSMMYGSNRDTNSHGHYGNRRNCEHLDSESSAWNRARQLECPAVYPALQPVWNPAANRVVQPAVCPDDRSIAQLALWSWSNWSN